MNELQVFKNQEFGSVRTLVIKSEPWFVGKDVAEALGYAEPRSAVSKKVDNVDRGVAEMETPSGKQNMTIINESGLYALIFGSKLESAKRFKHWVTSEVLPTIRKKGSYSIQPTLPKTYKEALIELVAQVEANEKLELENKIQSQQINELKPKASYYDVVLNCKDLLSISVIAKDYGWSAIRLNEYLHKKGIQFKQGKTWLLYQKYAVKGYTSTKTHEYLGNDGANHTNVHTYWTQKGRLFIYDLLKNDGIVPLIERDENG